MFLFSFSQVFFAQDTANSSLSDSIVYSKIAVEEQAEFPGGYNALQQYIKQNLKWPKVEGPCEIVGKVYVEFTIETDGSVKDVKVIKGLSAAFDKEAIRVVESMPKWKPAMEKGKPVQMKFTIPITFKR